MVVSNYNVEKLTSIKKGISPLDESRLIRGYNVLKHFFQAKSLEKVFHWPHAYFITCEVLFLMWNFHMRNIKRHMWYILRPYLLHMVRSAFTCKAKNMLSFIMWILRCTCDFKMWNLKSENHMWNFSGNMWNDLFHMVLPLLCFFKNMSHVNLKIHVWFANVKCTFTS